MGNGIRAPFYDSDSLPCADVRVDYAVKPSSPYTDVFISQLPITKKGTSQKARRMNQVTEAQPGDIMVIYRTRATGQKAEYTSVVTSICVVEEIRTQNDFSDFEQFFAYANTYSVFNREDLQYWYKRGSCYTIKMTYNAALSKRLIRKKLIEEIGIDREAYWGFVRLTDLQFNKILEEGGVLEGIVVD